MIKIDSGVSFSVILVLIRLLIWCHCLRPAIKINEFIFNSLRLALSLHSMKKDSLLILSGGMDSVTMLYEYLDDIALALSFDYGANHNAKEIPFAQLHCQRLGIKHVVIPLQFMHDYFKSSLLSGADAIPEGHYSSENMKVKIQEEPLREQLMKRKGCLGIRVVRMKK